MIDMAAKMALREVMRILDEKADDVSNMVVEGLFDTEATLTAKGAADYLLNTVLPELTLQIGQVVATLIPPSTEPEKEVMPSNTEVESLA